MWQHETFIHFGYITVDIIGCVDGKYEHNSADATCQDFAKIPLRSPLSLYLLSLVSSTTVVSSSRYAPLPFSLSNVTLSDDVISYRVLYISQRISGGRLRFARHLAGEWDFPRIRRAHCEWTLKLLNLRELKNASARKWYAINVLGYEIRTTKIIVIYKSNNLIFKEILLRLFINYGTIRIQFFWDKCT